MNFNYHQGSWVFLWKLNIRVQELVLCRKCGGEMWQGHFLLHTTTWFIWLAPDLSVSTTVRSNISLDRHLNEQCVSKAPFRLPFLHSWWFYMSALGWVSLTQLSWEHVNRKHCSFLIPALSCRVTVLSRAPGAEHCTSIVTCFVRVLSSLKKHITNLL